MGKILVRGSINIDEFFTVPHIVKPGETLSSTAYSKRAGGKGANQAVSCAKAGADVDFVGAVGEDGEWLVTLLREYRVGVEGLGVEDETPTGRALIQLESSSAENCIVLLPGANHSSSVPLPPMSNYSHLLLQSEIPHAATLDALSAAHEASVVTIWNPSPLPEEKELVAFPWTKLNWIVVNEGEAEELAKALRTVAATEGTGLEMLRGVEALNEVNIIMTKGSKGVAASLRASEKFVEVPAGTVVGGVKDTTGAGDCFTGYLAAGLLLLGEEQVDNANLSKILSECTAAAAICVSKEGAMESVPTRMELQAQQNAH